MLYSTYLHRKYKYTNVQHCVAVSYILKEPNQLTRHLNVTSGLAFHFFGAKYSKRIFCLKGNLPILPPPNFSVPIMSWC